MRAVVKAVLMVVEKVATRASRMVVSMVARREESSAVQKEKLTEVLTVSTKAACWVDATAVKKVASSAASRVV